MYKKRVSPLIKKKTPVIIKIEKLMIQILFAGFLTPLPINYRISCINKILLHTLFVT